MTKIPQDRLACAEMIGKHIARVPRTWRSILDQKLAPLGLTQTRWLTLYTLKQSGQGLMQRELARIIGVKAPSLVRTLDQLVEQGLVERRASGNDRRSKQVFLTPAAAPLLQQIKEVIDAARLELLEGVSKEDMLLFLSVLEKIETNSHSILDQ